MNKKDLFCKDRAEEKVMDAMEQGQAHMARMLDVNFSQLFDATHPTLGGVRFPGILEAVHSRPLEIYLVRTTNRQDRTLEEIYPRPVPPAAPAPGPANPAAPNGGGGAAANPPAGNAGGAVMNPLAGNAGGAVMNPPAVAGGAVVEPPAVIAEGAGMNPPAENAGGAMMNPPAVIAGGAAVNPPAVNAGGAALLQPVAPAVNGGNNQNPDDDDIWAGNVAAAEQQNQDLSMLFERCTEGDQVQKLKEALLARSSSVKNHKKDGRQQDELLKRFGASSSWAIAVFHEPLAKNGNIPGIDDIGVWASSISLVALTRITDSMDIFSFSIIHEAKREDKTRYEVMEIFDREGFSMDLRASLSYMIAVEHPAIIEALLSPQERATKADEIRQRKSNFAQFENDANAERIQKGSRMSLFRSSVSTRPSQDYTSARAGDSAESRNSIRLISTLRGLFCEKVNTILGQAGREESVSELALAMGVYLSRHTTRGVARSAHWPQAIVVSVMTFGLGVGKIYQKDTLTESKIRDHARDIERIANDNASLAHTTLKDSLYTLLEVYALVFHADLTTAIRKRIRVVCDAKDSKAMSMTCDDPDERSIRMEKVLVHVMGEIYHSVVVDDRCLLDEMVSRVESTPADMDDTVIRMIWSSNPNKRGRDTDSEEKDGPLKSGTTPSRNASRTANKADDDCSAICKSEFKEKADNWESSWLNKKSGCKFPGCSFRHGRKTFDACGINASNVKERFAKTWDEKK